jgi:hypothetical protein
LPEAESFEKEYRDKWGIKTALKRANQLTDGIPSEIVVEGATFTRNDYKEFTTAYSLYIFFDQSGVYRKSIKEFLKVKNVRFGDFLRQFYQECYPLLKLASLESFTNFEKHLDELVSDEINETFHNLKWLNHDGPQVHRYIYFIIEYFKHYEILGPVVEKWFIENGVNASLVQDESEIIYSAKRLNTTRGFIKKKCRDCGGTNFRMGARWPLSLTARVWHLDRRGVGVCGKEWF